MFEGEECNFLFAWTISVIAVHVFFVLPVFLVGYLVLPCLPSTILILYLQLVGSAIEETTSCFRNATASILLFLLNYRPCQKGTFPEVEGGGGIFTVP